MKLTHKFAEMTPAKRPQDLHMDGTGLRFETMDHGGEYPDNAASNQAHRRRGPMLHLRADHADGKVVDSQGFMLDTEDK